MEVAGAALLLIVLTLAPLAIGGFFLVWAIVCVLRKPNATPPSLRTRYILASLGVFALSFAINAWLAFGHNISLPARHELAFTSIGLLVSTLVLALLGKGTGRAILAVAAVVSGILWLPFVMP